MIKFMKHVNAFLKEQLNSHLLKHHMEKSINIFKLKTY